MSNLNLCLISILTPRTGEGGGGGGGKFGGLLNMDRKCNVAYAEKLAAEKKGKKKKGGKKKKKK